MSTETSKARRCSSLGPGRSGPQCDLADGHDGPHYATRTTEWDTAAQSGRTMGRVFVDHESREVRFERGPGDVDTVQP